MNRPNVWKFQPGCLTLALYRPNGNLEYEVDLERCRTSAETLDWVAQVAGKSWATDTIIADLVRALDDRLDLQANMCSMGKSKTVNVKKIVRGRAVQPVEEPVASTPKADRAARQRRRPASRARPVLDD